MLCANYSRFCVTILLEITFLGKKYIIYLAKGGYLILNDVPVNDKFTFMRKLPDPKCATV